MVFKGTFDNISVISWQSVLLGEETSTQRKPSTYRKILTNLIIYITLYRIHLAMSGIRTRNFSGDII